mmetsp:Transcript_13832/g.59191  ORF Transcript_13832/g.59191 Transcript_13832/m.59191 type:complete len:495 (-) Transcript_13832:265-1749(-)
MALQPSSMVDAYAHASSPSSHASVAGSAGTSADDDDDTSAGRASAGGASSTEAASEVASSAEAASEVVPSGVASSDAASSDASVAISSSASSFSSFSSLIRAFCTLSATPEFFDCAMAIATRSSNEISSKDLAGIFGISTSAEETPRDSVSGGLAGGAAAEGFSPQPATGGRGSGASVASVDARVLSPIDSPFAARTRASKASSSGVFASRVIGCSVSEDGDFVFSCSFSFAAAFAAARALCARISSSRSRRSASFSETFPSSDEDVSSGGASAPASPGGAFPDFADWRARRASSSSLSAARRAIWSEAVKPPPRGSGTAGDGTRTASSSSPRVSGSTSVVVRASSFPPRGGSETSAATAGMFFLRSNPNAFARTPPRPRVESSRFEDSIFFALSSFVFSAVETRRDRFETNEDPPAFEAFEEEATSATSPAFLFLVASVGTTSSLGLGLNPTSSSYGGGFPAHVSRAFQSVFFRVGETSGAGGAGAGAGLVET